MSVSYQKLWDYLYFNKINKSDLAKRCKFSRNSLAKMGRSELVHLSIINSICQELDLKIEDILEITTDLKITRDGKEK